ncbi:MAG TPA: ChbG/HpnK family deacetylase [Moraxellaceae bacterium]|nr:ChbG/HpnK family deacetylase [Moraxellaceae bacterium]
MRQLCICADDYAMDAAIDAACLELLAAGRLSSVSCMTRSPRWPEAAAALRQQEGVEAGLHFDLTHPWPGVRVPPSVGVLLLRSFLGAIDREAVLRELQGQLDAFEAAMGRAPDFVDGHQHVHELPLIRDVVVAELSRRYGVAARRPWVRSTQSSHPGRGFKGWLLHRLGGSAFRARVAAAGLTHNADFIGVYDFDLDQETFLNQLGQWLATCHDDAVLMCHPAAGRVTDDVIATAREAEFTVLRGDAFGELLRRRDIRVTARSAIS